MADANKGGRRFNIIFSVLIAVLLWFYVVNVENPMGETTIPAVPVLLHGVETLDERGLIVTEISRETVNLKAAGKRKTFLKLFQTDLTLGVDLTPIQEPGDFALTGKVQPEISRVDSNVTLTEREGFVITVTVKKKASLTLPVQGEFQGNLASGFDLDPMILDHETIEVSGPEDLMSQLSHASFVLTGEGIRETITQEVSFTFIDVNGNKMDSESLLCNVEKIKVTLPVVKVYELPLRVKLKDGGGATEQEAKITISPETISLSGSEEVLSAMTEVLLGEMDLAEIFNNKSKTFAITLPPDVKNRSEAKEATVTVGVDLPMKSIGTSNIELVNVPKGYEASLVADSMQVWVRGTQEELGQLTGEHLRVVVDLEQAARRKGQQRVEAQVTLEGIQGPGVVGADYSLAIHLK